MGGDPRIAGSTPSDLASRKGAFAHLQVRQAKVDPCGLRGGHGSLLVVGLY